MRLGLWLAPFGELADPSLLAELARRAELTGWQAVFLWDHVEYRTPETPIADPWIALAAIASRTQSIKLGPMVTPVPRRHVHKLARETTTLDTLSGGRLILGVGLGSGRPAELSLDGAPIGSHVRARHLDHGLDVLTLCWQHHYRPRPLQHPRIPIWVGSEWPNRQPLRRAARWDGWFPVNLHNPDELASGIEELERNRPPTTRRRRFAVAIAGAPDLDPRPWRQAGATWWLTDFGPDPRLAHVRAVIEAGPPTTVPI